MSKKFEYKATPNESRRTFTIRRFVDGKMDSKYRTSRMSKYDFDSFKNNTSFDWYCFLRTNDEYQVIK